jgi:hypothetical protein
MIPEWLRGIWLRWTVFFPIAWVISWANVLFTWTAPLEDTTAIGPMDALHRWLTVGLLRLDAYYIPHVALILTAVLAGIAAVVAYKTERDHQYEHAVRDLGRVVNRYVLAAAMFAYGLAMLPPLLHRAPGPVDFISLYGEFTAHDVMEYGLAYGPFYQFLIGVEHVAAGALLLSRRTTLIGAILALIVMGHSAILIAGFSYGGTRLGAGFASPAGALMIMSFVLIVPEWRRLLDFLLLNRPAIRSEAVTPESQLLLSPIMQFRIRNAVLAIMLAPPVIRSIALLWDARKASPLAGVYQVSSFTRNGEPQPLRADAPSRWRMVAIATYGDRLMVRNADASRADFLLNGPAFNRGPWRSEKVRDSNGENGTLALTEIIDRKTGKVEPKDETLYFQRDSAHVVLTGRLNGDNIRAALTRVPDSAFKASRRGLWPRMTSPREKRP